MKTLDRYIIRQFLINFAILLFVLMAFFVLVDLIFSMDEFLKAGREHARRWAAREQGFDVVPDSFPAPGRWATTRATVWTIADFYGPLLLLVYVYLTGLVVVAAAGFTFAAMTRAGEMVAVISSGVSLYRLAAPVLIVGGMLIAVTLVNQELFIPSLAPKLLRERSQLSMESIDTFAVQYARDGGGNLFSAARFNASTQTMDHVVILERDEAGHVTRRIVATQGVWDERRQRWDLNDGYAQRPAANLDGARSDPPTLDPLALGPQSIEQFPTDLSPQVLMVRRAELYPALLSLAELGRLMRNPAADAASIQKIMHSRFSLLIVNILVLAMGLPFFLLREPANLMVQTLKATGVCLFGWMAGLLLLQLDLPDRSVVVAWLPVVALLPIAAAMMLTVRT